MVGESVGVGDLVSEDLVTVPTLTDLLPASMPAGWRQHPPPVASPVESRWWQVRLFGAVGTRLLRVAVSLDDYAAMGLAGGLWMHTSVSVVSGGGLLPTWREMVAVKEVVHEDRPVVQILPPRSQYISIAEVLHLWERIDAPTLPEAVYRRGGVL